MNGRTVVPAVMTALLFAGVVPASAAPCGVARRLVAEQCACNKDWTGRAAYRLCVRGAAEQWVREGGTGVCRTELTRCATRSVCGKPKAVTCISRGRCTIAANAEVCLQKGGIASDARSCCDMTAL